MFNESEAKYILDLARRSIEFYFKNQELLVVNETEVPVGRLKEKLACFVTLTIGGELRGCIGRTEATQFLYLDVIENAALAAFNDPRFAPLSEEELEKVKIEVSVLSVAQPVDFTNTEELLKKLRPGIDGVVIKRGSQWATYLPQVWEELPVKEKFLNSLCEKAGLPLDDWQKAGIEVLVYQVEVIE